MIFFVFFFILLAAHSENKQPIGNLTVNPVTPNSLINSNIYLPTKCESCIVFAREFESLTFHLPKQVF